jgi:hypothetical protein
MGAGGAFLVGQEGSNAVLGSLGHDHIAPTSVPAGPVGDYEGPGGGRGPYGGGGGGYGYGAPMHSAGFGELRG